MSIQSDITTALAGVAGGRVYAQFAPGEAPLPFVVWRILNKTDLATLGGSTGDQNTLVAFESYGQTYESALITADDVQLAIESAALLSYRETAPGEEYVLTDDVFMEPVYYGFWH